MDVVGVVDVVVTVDVVGGGVDDVVGVGMLLLLVLLMLLMLWVLC